MSNINLIVFETVDFKKVKKKLADDWKDDTEYSRRHRKAKLEMKAKSSYIKSALKGAAALGTLGAAKGTVRDGVRTLLGRPGQREALKRGAKGAAIGAIGGLGVNAFRRWRAKRKLEG